MRTNELINLASKFGYKTEKSAIGMQFIKNEYEDISGVTLNSSHYLISDSLPPQLAHAIIDYANTPVEERQNDKKWNVVIACQPTDFQTTFTIWTHDLEKQKYYTDFFAFKRDLCCSDAIFTDYEFDGLITYLKSLPDGDTYAKIAELGKREVKS